MIQRLLQRLVGYQHLLTPLLVLLVLVMFLIPVPLFLLDLMFTLNFSVSLMILLSVMYMPKPTSFAAFPSVLLLTTLFRLSLNVASTRIILLHGHEGTDGAGKVIQAFGQFVVGGEYILGLIIFAVIIIIQFVVINVGSSRIAEVTARFTLDAMPGKQMSIDADLNSGLIDEREAKTRRKELQEEADFFGAMDGAIKFVAKDAVASMLIVSINIIGGLCFGVLRHDMKVEEAATTFIILTIGDGLVSALPSLFISVAGGILTTRATARKTLGEDVLSQLLSDHKPMAVAAGSLFLFGLVPGLPNIPFFALSAFLGAMVYYLKQNPHAFSVEGAGALPAGLAPGGALPGEKTPSLAKGTEGEGEGVERLLRIDLMGLEVGYGLIPLVDARRGGNILDRVKSIRRQMAMEMGLIVPPIRIRDNLQLKPNQYQILIKGIPVASSQLMTGHCLAMNPGTATKAIEGTPTKEPAFGLEAYWIKEGAREFAQNLGYTVVDLPTVITTHLSETIKRHSHELLGRQETQALLDHLAESFPKVVEDLIPTILPLGTVQKVLQNLLVERVSIRDLLTILECLAEHGLQVRDGASLTELVRQAIGRTVVQPYLGETQELAAMVLAPDLEAQLHQALRSGDQGTFLALPPQAGQALLEQIQRAIEASAFSLQPVLLVSPGIRPALRRLLERVLPSLVILSQAEVPSQISILTVGVVGEP